MAIFRIFYNLWATLFLLLIISAVSRLIFSKREKPLLHFLDDVTFAAALPIMLFSKEGFARLIKQIKEYV